LQLNRPLPPPLVLLLQNAHGQSKLRSEILIIPKHKLQLNKPLLLLLLVLLLLVLLLPVPLLRRRRLAQTKVLDFKATFTLFQMYDYDKGFWSGFGLQSLFILEGMYISVR
jgi:hypothetical protein